MPVSEPAPAFLPSSNTTQGPAASCDRSRDYVYGRRSIQQVRRIRIEIEGLQERSHLWNSGGKTQGRLLLLGKEGQTGLSRLS